MARDFKIERTPLLGPGFHTMSLQDLKAITVDRFEGTTTRRELFLKLEGLVQEILKFGVPCDLWIDGSFLTEDEQPADIDIAVRVMDDVMEQLTQEQDNFLTRLSADDEAYVAGLDTFVFAGYWLGHQNYRTDVDEGFAPDVPTYGTQFGQGRDGWLKGIVVLSVRENDVGLRIRT
jgi:hypothetical protein